MKELKPVIRSIKFRIDQIDFEIGDLSDIGNEIGMAVGKHLSNELGFDKESFICGFNHGIEKS